MAQRKIIEVRTDPVTRRKVCLDESTALRILEFMAELPARNRKFEHILDRLVQKTHTSAHYELERDGVFAFKMYPGGQNTRIYCKEITGVNGDCYIILSELLPKKKNQKNGATENALIDKVKGYDFQINPSRKN